MLFNWFYDRTCRSDVMLEHIIHHHLNDLCQLNVHTNLKWKKKSFVCTLSWSYSFLIDNELNDSPSKVKKTHHIWKSLCLFTFRCKMLHWIMHVHCDFPMQSCICRFLSLSLTPSFWSLDGKSIRFTFTLTSLVCLHDLKLKLLQPLDVKCDTACNL